MSTIHTKLEYVLTTTTQQHNSLSHTIKHWLNLIGIFFGAFMVIFLGAIALWYVSLALYYVFNPKVEFPSS